MNNNIKQTYPVNIFIGEDEYNFTLLYKIEKGPFKDTEFNILNKTSCGTNAKFTAEEICKRYNQYPDIMRENEELKARCETYKKDYESMVAEVLRLSGENSKMREMINERIKELE